MRPFGEAQFRHKVNAAIAAVKRCLDDNRRPCFPGDVAHQYEDKYLLAEFSTNASIAAYLNALAAVGLDKEKLAAAREWANKGKAVTLRFEATERCKFDREEVRKEESAELVSKSTWRGETKTSVVSKIPEYYYKVSVTHALVLYGGANPTDATWRMVLGERTGETEVLCTTKNAPRPETKVVPPIEAPITWFLQQQSHDGTLHFKIDRDHDDCKTPRRNKDVDEALAAFSGMQVFSNRLTAYVRDSIFSLPRLPGRPKLDSAAALRQDAVFIPVLPLLEEDHDPAATEGGEAQAAAAPAPAPAGTPAQGTVATMPPSGSVLLLQAADVNALLAEQERSLAEHSKLLADTFPLPASEDAASHTEAMLAATFVHVGELSQRYSDCVDCVEGMIRAQLYEAIGKEVTSADFDAYMAYHQRKVFAAAYAPQPFCHAIRRPEHYPEGTVAIEGTDAAHEPILTQTRAIPADMAEPVCIRLNAATQVQLAGPQYLHGYVANSFASVGGRDLQLVARARQFSSFMLIVGKMVPGGGLDPEHAIIVQNKDDLKIPLLLEKLPTAKAFRDAVESLSPEMKRFAKAYRAMQLSGTVFGIAVVQLKPQLERLLQLPVDGLTKEIALTQRLLGLFIEHQIPSDLLRFDGDPSLPTSDKLDAVRASVKSIEDMMASEREAEIKAREEEERFKQPLAMPPPAPGGGGPVFGGAGPPMEMMMQKNMMDASEDTRRVYKKKGGAQMRSRSARSVAMPMSAAPMASMAPRPGPPVAMEMAMACDDGASFEGLDEVGDMELEVSTGEATGASEGKTVADGAPAADDTGFNFCSIPGVLDQRFEAFDPDAALASTTIKLQPTWERTQQRKLLAKPSTLLLRSDEQKTEKNRAFDLLDALSRSGTLPIECSELHVLIAATHCFDKSVMETVVVDNINPIEKVERSAMILGATIQGVEAPLLIKESERKRIILYSAPVLMSAAALE